MEKLIFKTFILAIGLSWFISANVIGSVTRLRGEVQVDRMGRSFSINMRTDIENKDIISTNSRSFVQVQMIDGGTINIGENSVFGFQKYSYNRNIEAYMVLQNGFFRVQSGQIGKLAPQRFRIDTKTAIIGIRGTDFYGLIDGSYEDIGCVDGEIFVDTQTQRFHLKAGERIVKKNRVWQKLLFPAELYRIPRNGILRFQRALHKRCPSGKVWSRYMKRCILEPNSTPPPTPNNPYNPRAIQCRPTMILDRTGTKCVCPVGTSWSKNMNMCTTEAQKREYCNKNFPGTVPVNTDRGCECPNRFWWSKKYRRCINPIEYCEKRVSKSIPIITQDDRIECHCPKGYYFGERTKTCYKYGNYTSEPKLQGGVTDGVVTQPNPVVTGYTPITPTHRNNRRHHRHRRKYIVPAIIGAAIIGGAIIIHQQHRKNQTRRRPRHRFLHPTP